MRILMRNTVFKTAALAGLFLCMLMLAGAFSGITTSAHAVHAEDVETEEQLRQFVTEAVDEYYIKFLLKEHCDLRDLNLPENLKALIPQFLPSPIVGLSVPITDLSPDSIQMLTTEDVRKLIGLFNSPTVQPLLAGVELDIWGTCDLQPTSTFRDVFTEEAANWKSGSIYLFVMNDEKELLFHGDDQDLEGQVLEARDEGDRDVGQLIVNEADDPMNNGIVKYCWDDPTTDEDNIVEAENDSTIAPGDSLKVSYVIDPFSSLGVPGPSGSPGIILGSGIYPGPDSEFPECNGDGVVGDGGGMEPMEPTEPPMEPPMEPEPTSVSGGGCAIAGGGDSTPRNDALNLLLMVSTLFLAVSFGNRAAGRRNAIRS